MILEFPSNHKDLVFCIIDNTWSYKSGWTKELIKNQSDFAITNITHKGFTVLQGLDEDSLLNEASEKYKFAVVMSTGTELIKGTSFFDSVLEECTDNFLVKGHILDRGNAYYELHHQCYLVNLHNYKLCNKPKIGSQYLGEKHTKVKPVRSSANIHDDYTPIEIYQGNDFEFYEHKLHGWNIIDKALQFTGSIPAFGQEIRSSKRYLYPENQELFLQNSDYIYKKEEYCATQLVHRETTEEICFDYNNFEQIVAPASGFWWLPITSKNCSVFVYDYNERSIDYWRERYPEFSYFRANLLCDNIDFTFLDPSKRTLVNLSNIFAYEGTMYTFSLEKRLQKENEIIQKIQQTVPNAVIYFSMRSCTGFVSHEFLDTAKNTKTFELCDIKTPTWHCNGEWTH